MPDRSWMSYIMPFGKHKGDTLQIVRMNDIEYVVWLSEQEPMHTLHEETINKCKKCIEYLREVDPYAIEKWRR